MRNRSGSAVAIVALLTAFGAVDAHAQSWLSRALAFRGTLGFEDVGSSLGNVFDRGARTEWSVLFRTSPVLFVRPRVGVGISRVTYEVLDIHQQAVDANAHARRWNHVRWHLLAGVELPNLMSSTIDLYFEVRAVTGRLRSQTELDWPVVADPPTVRPYRDWGSKGSEYVVGVKTDLGFLPFDIDVLYRHGKIEPRRPGVFDLSDYQLGLHGDSDASGVQFGIFWRP